MDVSIKFMSIFIIVNKSTNIFKKNVYNII